MEYVRYAKKSDEVRRMELILLIAFSEFVVANKKELEGWMKD